MPIRDYWGSSDAVFQCLVDAKRLRAIKKSINHVVTRESVVVDLGSGSGILALLALEAGAKKVYAVEADPSLCKCIEMTKKINKLDSRLIVLNADARVVRLPEKVDVVLCEMIATGLIDELQLPVINNIKKFCKFSTSFLPESIKNYATLVHSNDRYCGKKMHVIAYDYFENGSLRARPLSEKKLYSNINFASGFPSKINISIPLCIKKRGIVNGIKISSYATFPGSITLGNTFAFCMPVILPINDCRVFEGEQYRINLDYKMCAGFENLKYGIDGISAGVSV